MGNIATIYPLRNEKVTLFELLASVGGMRNDLRGSNIRLIRGDLRNPNVYVINLRTMEAYKQSLEGMKPYNSFTLEPNDIIYIEPVRKTFWEAFADVASPIATLASTTATVLALIAILRSGK
jgi:polysaccharide export outer membrane protein